MTNGSKVEQIRSEVEKASQTVAEMVRHLSSTKATVPGSSWTVGENAAHLAIAQRYFTDLVEGAVSPYVHIEEFEALNKGFLSEFEERDGARLADLLQKGTDAFLDATSGLPEDRLINWHLGEKLGVLPFTSYVLYHLLAHSYEIAKGLGLPNPIKPLQALMTVPFFVAVAPYVVNAEKASALRARVQLRFRGGPRVDLVFNDRRLAIEQDSHARADCYLSAEPVAFFLVATKLVDQWGPMMRGRLIAWGRRPWLALRLTGLLQTP